MNEQLKKFTAELKEKFAASIQSKEMQEAIASIKAAQDTGTFEVIISTADVDRAGEIVDQNGWILDHFKNNPVVLWAHDYSQLPVGVCDSIELKDGKLVAKGRFAPHEFAQNVRQLYDLKMIRATSVGFIPMEMEGNTITKAELLEFSFVPVPANPFALSLAKSSNLNVAELITKGLLTKEAEGATNEPAKDGNEAVKPESEAVEGEKPQETAENAEIAENQPTEPVAAADAKNAQAKGAVADEISADQEWEKKWEMISPFDDIIYAFYDVYFDENTKADQFQYWIPSGQTKYFKATFQFPKLSQGEFVIKAFGSLGAYGSLDPSWYSNDWSYRIPITINTSKIGTTTALSNFPFGISTTSAQFAYTSFGGHVGKTDGTDIVITDSDGTTKLSHELEKYSSSTGEVILHFKYTNTVPTTSTTTVYMYYGNSGASDQQDRTNVWDSNFKIVLHMNQPATATQTDSTAVGNNAAKTNTPVADTGTFGSAVRFGLPGPSYLSASNVGALTDFTVCALYKASTTLPTYFRIADQDYANGFALGRVTAEQTRLYVRNTGTNQFNLSFGAWHYTCGVRSGTNGYLWADTSKTSNTNVGTTAFGTSDPLRIATSVNNPTGDYMNGPIDEFRISNTARSNAWLYTEYQYLMNQSTFYIWGTEESATPAAVAPLWYNKGNIYINGNVYAK